MPKSVSEMVSEAKAQIENLTVEQVAAELRSGTLILDVREPEERAQNGLIPGSIGAPRGMLEFYADPATPYYMEQLRPDRRCILYCAAGSRSALGVLALKEQGYTSVAHLDGGFRAWQEAGREVQPAG